MVNPIVWWQNVSVAVFLIDSCTDSSTKEMVLYERIMQTRIAKVWNIGGILPKKSQGRKNYRQELVSL